MPAPAPASDEPIGIAPRLLCMLYEALLVLAVAFFAGWLFDFSTRHYPLPTLRLWRQLWLFAVLGLYFIWFWHRSGQTLAMKTWRIRLQRNDGARLTLPQAGARYLLCYLWFLPACVLSYGLGLKGWSSLAVLAAGVLAWGSAARLDARRQYLHDRWLGTQLVRLAAHPAQKRS